MVVARAMATKTENGDTLNGDILPMLNKEKWLPDEADDNGLDREWWSIDECPEPEKCQSKNFKKSNTGL